MTSQLINTTVKYLGGTYIGTIRPYVPSTASAAGVESAASDGITSNKSVAETTNNNRSVIDNFNNAIVVTMADKTDVSSISETEWLSMLEPLNKKLVQLKKNEPPDKNNLIFQLELLYCILYIYNELCILQKKVEKSTYYNSYKSTITEMNNVEDKIRKISGGSSSKRRRLTKRSQHKTTQRKRAKKNSY